MVPFNSSISSPYAMSLGGVNPMIDIRHGQFSRLRREADTCGCKQYRQFFRDNQESIRDRCRGRNPHDYRTDERGCRYENGRVAQTQIAQQGPTSATINAGNNKLTFDKSNQSLHIQNADGTEQSVDLNYWGDPHAVQNGRNLGTFQENISLTLKDNTQVNLLMGDGNGGKPKAGHASYIDTVSVRSPDGTGALVTGISGPGNLGVTPLDSSLSSEYMANQAMNRFGQYEASEVSVDRNGNMIDKSNGQVIHDQYGLNRLDQEQRNKVAAGKLFDQGYTPQTLADRYDQPFDRYNNDMRSECEAQMARMTQRLEQLQEKFQDLAEVSMQFARHPVLLRRAQLPLQAM